MGRSKPTSKSQSRSRSRSRSRHRERRHRSRSRSRSVSTSSEDDGFRIHVADLGIDCSKRELENAFKKFGPLLEVWLAHNPPCFAFVVFQYREDAEEAIQNMNGKQICGSRIKVSLARPRTRGLQRKRGFDPNLRCYQCGECGHFSRDCDQVWRLRKQQPPGSSRAGPLRFNLSEHWEISDDDIINFNRTPSRSKSRSRSRSRSRSKSRSSRHKKSKHRKSSRSKEGSRHKKRSHKDKKEKHESSKDRSKRSDETSEKPAANDNEIAAPMDVVETSATEAAPRPEASLSVNTEAKSVSSSCVPPSEGSSSVAIEPSLRDVSSRHLPLGDRNSTLATGSELTSAGETPNKVITPEPDVTLPVVSPEKPTGGKIIPTTTAGLVSPSQKAISPSAVKLTIMSSNKMTMIPRVVTVSANNRIQS